MIMLNLAAKFAISNNLNPLGITSDVYFPSKQIYIKNLESKSLIKSFDISDIPLDLKTTVYGSNFVRIVDEKYIILASGPALVEAGKSSIWVMDGTFKCVAKNYFQLYTISTKSEIDGKGRAAIFGLLMNKKTDKYKKFFQDVRNECFKECQLHNIDPLFSQKTIVCDKEVAAYDTAMKIFDCKIQLCYFHTITNIQKKLRSVGLGLCYQRKVEGYDLRSNYELRYAKDLYRLIKHCYTLFFFPLDKCLLFYSVHIEPEILRIANLLREKKNSILKFKNYLLKEWLTDGKKFKVSQCLVFKQTVLTTNIAESLFAGEYGVSLLLKDGEAIHASSVITKGYNAGNPCKIRFEYKTMTRVDGYLYEHNETMHSVKGFMTFAKPVKVTNGFCKICEYGVNLLLKDGEAIHASSVITKGYNAGTSCKIRFENKIMTEVDGYLYEHNETMHFVKGYMTFAKPVMVEDGFCEEIDITVEIPYEDNDDINALSFYLRPIISKASSILFQCIPSGIISFTNEDDAEEKLKPFWTTQMSIPILDILKQDFRSDINTFPLLSYRGNLLHDDTLDEHQKALANSICGGTKLISCLAPAGTGKTQSICSALSTGITHGKRYLVVGPTNKACDDTMKQCTLLKDS
uniref:MULE domain-containing protein n=1 Tax=Strongyloides papillosus TaxID=174720 RepID=A0A0N5B4M4_STREA